MTTGRQLARWAAAIGFLALAGFAAMLVVRSAERFYYAFATNVVTDDLTMRHIAIARETTALTLAIGSSIVAYFLLRFALTPRRQ
jgi:hypothetical protein